VRIAALTNGSAGTTKKMFQKARLETFVEGYISIDEVKDWNLRAKFICTPRKRSMSIQRRSH